MESYREEAAVQSGIGQVAALPTGLIAFDMRIFELTDPQPEDLRRWLETGIVQKPWDEMAAVVSEPSQSVVFGNGEPKNTAIEETVERIHKQCCPFPWYVRASWRERDGMPRILLEVTDKKVFSEPELLALILDDKCEYGIDVKDANDLERFQPNQPKMSIEQAPELPAQMPGMPMIVDLQALQRIVAEAAVKPAELDVP